ncbi:hypothetical protein GCK32_001067 [Trichostrongylus colubriformis]|uniref:Guanylate cyclase n=1 Tax=Trichostrongylus colubriformis TaxID=6319 RepID=A0AAN8GEW2_TRICO
MIIQILLILFCSYESILTQQKRTITVGIAAVENVLPTFMGFSQSGGAIGLALDRMRSEGIVDGFDFKFLVNYTECSPVTAVGVVLEYMVKQNADVIIGPPCPAPAKMTGYLSTYYQKIMLGWGFLIDYIFSDTQRFKYLTKVMPDSIQMMYAMLEMFKMFEWNRVAIYYTPNEVQFCDTMIDDVVTAFSDGSSYLVDIVQKVSWDGQDNGYLTDQLLRTQRSARIVVICLDTAQSRRKFMKKVATMDMISEEYVYVMIGLRGFGFGQAARGIGEREYKISQSFLLNTVDNNADDVSPDIVKDFQAKVVQRVREDPLYCKTPACLSNDGKQMATWARYLHDVFYLYGLSLNESLTLDPVGGQSNATTLTQSMERSFLGLTGLVAINSNGTRIPLFSAYVLDPNFNQMTAINFTYLNGKASMTKGYTNEAETMWATRGGKRPLARPKCGYLGTDCPKPFWEQYGVYVIVGAALLGVLLISTVAFIIYVMRMREEEREQQRLLWQIPYMKLRKPTTSREMQQQSKRSLQSGKSSVMTGDSKLSESNFGDYEIYLLDNDTVLTTKFSLTRLTEEDCLRFPQMRKLDHDNVNRFIGLSIDGAEYVAIWRMCSRGTLQELILKGSLWLDPFFMLCIMRDIAEGLRFLHNSFIGCHGRLRSECCLVTDSWQVKISDYGLGSLREDDGLKKKRLLWLAPEHLRTPETSARMSKEGDIYSFAIIASEVVTRKAAWNLQERKEGTDELLYMLKKGGHTPPRPDLNTDGEINVAVLHLIRDCWSEKPDDRPNADTLCNNLKLMMPDKKSNLMDHMFNMLEDYTTTLELDVEERTKQLQEEKKKADLLLGRMLPRQVADRLKSGQTVEPEGFDSVTVFFSDVVKFTQLAAKCTAFQIVNLLNDLYNGFDSIIEEHSVYKVESIGDGYLCVSGLPVRNGYAHIKEISELSLSFMKFVDEFRISHLPKERVQLRIGVNSGPCVAGVVGLSMPRYCLFGDTVNTSSRMESNGKPGLTHLSKEAHDLLMKEYHADYETQLRGEVLIKGKGVMETFWLIGRKNTFSRAHPPGQRVEESRSNVQQNAPLRIEAAESDCRLTNTYQPRMIPLILFCLYVPTIPQQQQKKTITVGIAAVENVLPSFMGFSLSGGAIGLALDRMRAEGIMYGFDFRFVVNYTECDSVAAVGVALEFMVRQNVDLIIGPPCPPPAEMTGYLSTYYKKTMLGWGFLIDYIFSDTKRFKYLTKVMPDSIQMMYSMSQMFMMFEWNRVAIYYTPNEVRYCDTIIDDAITAFSDDSFYVIDVVQKVAWDGQDTDYFTDQLLRTKRSARIILMCMDTAQNRRQFMKKVSSMDMISEEYVYVLVAMRGFGFGQATRGISELSNGLTPFWEDLDNNHADDAIVDINGDDVDPAALKEFQSKVVARMATWARQYGERIWFLHDVFYLYGLSLNQSLTLDPIGGQSNASTLSQSMERSFVGLTGLVTINSNGTRIPLFSAYVLDSNFNQITAINFTTIEGRTIMTKGYTNEAQTLWATRGGQRPLVRPKCGYTGTDCPKPFWEQYGIYIVVGAALIGVLLIAGGIFIVYVMRIRKEEREQQRLLWQIPYMKLRKPPNSRELQQQSKRSLQSGKASVMTGDSKLTESNFGEYEIYFLENDAVLTTKYSISGLTEEDNSRFPQMRKLDHDNVNRFIGLSIDGAEYVAIWRMCSRGTLQELILKGSLWFDPFFMLCIMRDVAEGLRFLHNSFIGCHGRLRSECCLVTDSWQVKISDYGLGSLREDDGLKKKRLLWLAPEHLRSPDTSSKASKEGDIYSFAIIASEVITRKPAWNLHERKERTDELLYMLKKGGATPPRPDLNTDGEVNAAALHLIRDCWSEKPADRPTGDTLCKILKTMMPNKKSNLMDHMFNMLEDYTTTLELDVEERTKQLQEEKKKADILLGRMLPRQVADRLKMGQTVEPEGFDSVTVFFSDVVKFTQLAAKCTAFQIVNLLNDLYNGFDSIIEEHSVYKVESIGDGYLCVSGLPMRNGYAHIKEISELSLSFMRFVDEFRISHLPKERVQLRIGINSGPCVAGVVGLSMPRYCLFGDTVNTSSRMESNGKPGHIHLSKVAHDLLVKEYRTDYETQPRGEVIIKGKGVMETFWLIGRKYAFSTAPPAFDASIKPKTAEGSEQRNLPSRGVTADKTPPMTPNVGSTNAMYRDYLRSNTLDSS